MSKKTRSRVASVGRRIENFGSLRRIVADKEALRRLHKGSAETIQSLPQEPTAPKREKTKVEFYLEIEISELKQKIRERSEFIEESADSLLGTDVIAKLQKEVEKLKRQLEELKIKKRNAQRWAIEKNL